MQPNSTPRLARVVPGGEPYRSEQGTVYQPGISDQTVGASAIFLGMVTLPPMERTKAHVHEHHESAFFVLSGSDIELWSGERLQDCARARQGDYLFIPSNVPHGRPECVGGDSQESPGSDCRVGCMASRSNRSTTGRSGASGSF
ncbi:MAG: cupin domain-containing protein [Burkholderiaceae bacterium]|nr:cupin domain-containing protein [Burkholderiaceae bacterium]